MHIHANAKLVPSQRLLLVRRVLEDHWKVGEAAVAFGISERTAYRWLARWRSGDRRLVDRSSAPHRVPRRTPFGVERQIERLRRLRFTSTRIAATLHMAVSTVCAVLARLGLGRRWRLGPPEPPNRYERRQPGELVHIDTKKLGRFDRPGHRVTGDRRKGQSPGAGWDVVHVCIDDHTRVAYVEVLDDEAPDTTIAFMTRARDWFAARGVHIERVMSDNGNPYRSKAFAAWCAISALQHLRIQPGRPRTNGKAERFIQTLLREWAYAAVYQTNRHRTLALQPWLDYYNHQRPHGALGHRAPMTRLPAA